MSQHKTISLNRGSFDIEKALKSYGSITAIYNLDSYGAISQKISIPNQINKIKLNSVGTNMLYAEILTEDADLKNVFSLSYESNAFCLDGKTQDSNYNSDFLSFIMYILNEFVFNLPIYLKFAVTVIIGSVYFYFFDNKKKKFANAETSIIAIEEPPKKNIEVFLDKILGNGSQGTIVFEGIFQQRPVAVKRMLKNFIKEAKQEVALLIKADAHSNVVSFFAWEEDETFVYLALEKCVGTLADIVSDSMKKKKKPIKFKKNLDTLKILQESAKGLSYLHRLNIVHRDIKPMNILIDSKGNAKIADMASGKRLSKDASSFGTQMHGSSGWQPKEVLSNQRRTKAVDIFSLGCTFYYALTKGQHPFGSRIQRDNNIISGTYLLPGITPEARHLIERMISQNPSIRPSSEYVYQHCMF